MTTIMEAPRAASELYLARGDEVSPWRPVMTVDVFADVDIPGVEPWDGDEEKLAMVVAHPCAMREGPRLKSRLSVVRVVSCQEILLSEWPKRHFSLMPLPDLAGAAAEGEERESEPPPAVVHHAAIFELRGRVETSALDLAKRRACLTEEGVAYLHQRMCHNDTRHPPSVRELMTACAGVFAEIEQAEEWNEALIDAAVLAEPELLHAALERTALDFDAELTVKRTYGKKQSSLRDDLDDPTKRPNARRRIAALRKERTLQRTKAG